MSCIIKALTLKNTAAEAVSGRDGCVALTHTDTTHPIYMTHLPRSSLPFSSVMSLPQTRGPEQDTVMLLIKGRKWSRRHGCMCRDNECISLKYSWLSSGTFIQSIRAAFSPWKLNYDPLYTQEIACQKGEYSLYHIRLGWDGILSFRSPKMVHI